MLACMEQAVYRSFTVPYSAGGSLKDAHECTVILATVKSESNTCVHLATFIYFVWLNFVSCPCPSLGPQRGDKRAMFAGNVSRKCFLRRGEGARQDGLGKSQVGKGIPYRLTCCVSLHTRRIS